MKKSFVPKAFLLFTLLFILIAAFSFVAFRDTEDVSNSAQDACKIVKPTRSSEMIWEMVSRQFLSLISI